MNNCSVENDMIKQSHVMFITDYNDEICYWYTEDTIRSVRDWWFSDNFDGPCNDAPLLALFINGKKIFDYTELYQKKPDSLLGFPSFENLFDILEPMEDNDIEVYFEADGKEYRFFDASNVAEEWKERGILSGFNMISNVKIGDVPVKVNSLRDLVELLDVDDRSAKLLAEFDDQREIEEEKNAMHGFCEPDYKAALSAANNLIDALVLSLAENAKNTMVGDYSLVLPNGYWLDYKCPQTADEKHVWILRNTDGGYAGWMSSSAEYTTEINLAQIKTAVQLTRSTEELYKVGDEVRWTSRFCYVAAVLQNGLKLYDTTTCEVRTITDLDTVEKIGHNEMAEKVFS